MKIIENKEELIGAIANLKSNNKSVGLVLTMGALHEGHLSLVHEANKNNDIVIVSIFVNPTQFNDPKDYNRYPRILSDDIEELKKVKCDILFIPSEKEMYPHEDKREFDFGNLDKILEGKYRPGHFKGVALIVSKFFEIIKPDKAYFGEKDFQQVVIIKHLTKLMGSSIEIIACPIIRESDGLAMSSRNMLLSKEERENVSLISQTLLKARKMAKELNVKQVKNWVISKINNNPFLNVEYFEIVDDKSLESIFDWEQQNYKIGFIAVHIGNIRLIDNIRFYS